MPIKPKVLVADDEPVIADTLAMILNQSGFEARAVYSGEDALKLASTFPADMLISDVIMAGLNGIDAAICVRAILPQIKILLFSGQAATAGLLEQARVNGYEFEILAKPVHPKELLKKLQSSGIYPAFQQAVKGTAQSAVQQEQIDISPLDLPIDPAGSSPKEN